jgi:hypothetical protein
LGVASDLLSVDHLLKEFHDADTAISDIRGVVKPGISATLFTVNFEPLI